MLEIKAEPRKLLGKKVNNQRDAGQVPAVVYGHGIKSEPVFVSKKEFSKAYREAGESSLVILNLEGKKRNVLIHGIQTDPVRNEIIHADFYQVKMDEKIKAKVPIVFLGESPLVKSEGGVLIKNIQEVEVEALPQDLPRNLEVDTALLKSFDDHIFIKDLNVASGVKISADPSEIVASVTPPRSEEELAALEEKIEEKIEEVKVIKEEKEAIAEETPTGEEGSGK